VGIVGVTAPRLPNLIRLGSRILGRRVRVQGAGEHLQRRTDFSSGNMRSPVLARCYNVPIARGPRGGKRRAETGSVGAR
jgi:hypothetical protein